VPIHKKHLTMKRGLNFINFIKQKKILIVGKKIRKKNLSTFLETRKFKIWNLLSFILAIQKKQRQKWCFWYTTMWKNILFKELNNCNATIMVTRVLCHAFIIIKWQCDKYHKSYQQPETVEHSTSGCTPYLETHRESTGITHPEIVISRLGRGNGLVVTQTTELMNEWMNGRVSERKNERTNKWTSEWMNEWMKQLFIMDF
jgi:hypothetical protein